MTEYLVVVIAPDRRCEVYLLESAGWQDGKTWSHVAIVNMKDKPTMDSKLEENCIFVLINQCQVKEKIKSLLSDISKLNKKIIVWTHQTKEGNHAPFECNEIKKILNENKLIDCQDFSHPSDIPGKGVLAFMNSSANHNNWDKRKKILQNFMDETVKKKDTSVAHTLRSEILTPFIPFHLFYQLDNKESLSAYKEWQNVFKECCSAINNTDKGKNIEAKFEVLKGLKGNIPQEIKDCATGRFIALKNIFQKNENDCVKNIVKNDCHKTIEDFAQCLEKMVNCIESGEEASAKNE